jgi:hypothetical protein
MGCRICEHTQRKAIEEHLLTFNYGNEGMKLGDIAKKFGVPLSDLQVHALMHSRAKEFEESEGPSLVQDIKKREAGDLKNVTDEYWATLRLAGKIIREDFQGEARGRSVTRQMVEIYLGAGNNIRQNVATLAEINTRLNGEQDKGLGALADVVNAIRLGPKRVGADGE